MIDRLVAQGQAAVTPFTNMQANQTAQQNTNDPSSDLPTRQQIEPYAVAAAEQNGIPPDLFLRLINAESSFNQGARSPAGAIGLTQLMPNTAAGLNVNPYDWRQNLLGGARYLAQLKGQFGDWTHAVAAYNSGPGNVQAALPGLPQIYSPQYPDSSYRDYLATVVGGYGAQVVNPGVGNGTTGTTNGGIPETVHIGGEGTITLPGGFQIPAPSFDVPNPVAGAVDWIKQHRGAAVFVPLGVILLILGAAGLAFAAANKVASSPTGQAAIKGAELAAA